MVNKQERRQAGVRESSGGRNGWRLASSGRGDKGRKGYRPRFQTALQTWAGGGGGAQIQCGRALIGPSWDAQGSHLGAADGQAAIRRCRDSGEGPAGLQSSWALSLLPQKPQSRGVKPCRAWGSSAAALTSPSALRVPSGRVGVRRPVQLVRGRPQ